MITWNEKKAAIVAALEEYGYVKNKVVNTWQKTIEDSPMICTVDLKTQNEPGESIPVFMIDPENLDQPPSKQDIGGMIGSTQHTIRTAINDLETLQTEPKTEQSDPIPDKPDQLTTEHVENVPLPPTTKMPAIVHTTNSVELTVDIVQQYINSDATQKQAFNFMAFCQAHGLDPFKHEAHLIIFKGKATNVIGVDGNIKRAQEQPDYNGYEAGIIVKKEDGTIDEREGSFLLEEETLVGGWCKVYRKNIKYPFVSKVTLDEYIQMNKEGNPNKIWATKPATMIAKVPTSQCHRKAYAGINSGGYEQIEIKDLGEVEVIE